MKVKRQAQGFTLIELLVVLFIISIVTTVALLSISHNDNKRLESLANELTQTVSLAEEQAMLQPNILGLAIENNTFHFASLKPAVGEKKQDMWMPLEDRLLGMHNIPSDIEIAVDVATAHAAKDQAATSIPKIIISANGDVTPFKIYIGKKGEKPRFVIIGDADGNITNQLLS